MIGIVIVLAYVAVVGIGLEVQKTDLLLGHTIGSFGVVILSIFVADYFARKWN
jgi:hypothetical protein